MHAHIQEIERSIRALCEIEAAFWNGRHPEWTTTEKYGKTRGVEYTHVFEHALSPSLAETSGYATVTFVWVARVDWARDPALCHEFRTSVSIGEGSIIEYALPARAVFRHDEVRVGHEPVITRWRQGYRAAAALMGVTLPESFDWPTHGVETFRAPAIDVKHLPAFVSAVGRLILDDLCDVPHPHGV